MHHRRLRVNAKARPGALPVPANRKVCRLCSKPTVLRPLGRRGGRDPRDRHR
jgi:hypothetical protein